MSKSPAAIVKEQFGDKAKLVAALGPFTSDDLWVNRVNETKGLARISNAKLLRLHRVFTDVKEKFGSRVKLVDAICVFEKRAKDEGFKTRLLGYPVPRLYDMYRTSSRRNAAPAEPRKTAAKAKAATPATASAKAAPAKPTTGKTSEKPAAKKPSAKKS